MVTGRSFSLPVVYNLSKDIYQVVQVEKQLNLGLSGMGFFTGWMPFLLKIHQCQSTESNCKILVTANQLQVSK